MSGEVVYIRSPCLKLYTLNPKPQIQNRKPSILNPKPHSLYTSTTTPGGHAILAFCRHLGRGKMVTTKTAKPWMIWILAFRVIQGLLSHNIGIMQAIYRGSLWPQSKGSGSKFSRLKTCSPFGPASFGKKYGSNLTEGFRV